MSSTPQFKLKYTFPKHSLTHILEELDNLNEATYSIEQYNKNKTKQSRFCWIVFILSILYLIIINPIFRIGFGKYVLVLSIASFICAIVVGCQKKSLPPVEFKVIFELLGEFPNRINPTLPLSCEINVDPKEATTEDKVIKSGRSSSGRIKKTYRRNLLIISARDRDGNKLSLNLSEYTKTKSGIRVNHLYELRIIISPNLKKYKIIEKASIDFSSRIKYSNFSINKFEQKDNKFILSASSSRALGNLDALWQFVEISYMFIQPI